MKCWHRKVRHPGVSAGESCTMRNSASRVPTGSATGREKSTAIAPRRRSQLGCRHWHRRWRTRLRRGPATAEVGKYGAPDGCGTARSSIYRPDRCSDFEPRCWAGGVSVNRADRGVRAGPVAHQDDDVYDPRMYCAALFFQTLGRARAQRGQRRLPARTIGDGLGRGLSTSARPARRAGIDDEPTSGAAMARLRVAADQV